MMQLDLSQLRISNDTLSDDEILQLRSKRRQVQERLEALARDDEPKSPTPEPSLNDAKKTKKALQVQLSTYDALLAPHKLLPAELLSQIFIAAYPSSTYIPIQPRSSPLVLCQVCSRWRTVALATPELWTDVILRLSKHTSRRLSPEGAIDAVREWYGRSEASTSCTISLVLLNQLPVAQSVVSSPPDSSDDDLPHAADPKLDTHELLMGVLDRVVIPFAPRLRNLQLALPASLMVRFVKRTTTAFPELRRLSLSLKPGSHIQNWTRAGINFKPVVVFGRTTSPLLTDLELIGFHTVVPTQLLDVGWANVTRLNLSSAIKLLPGPCYSLLKRCRVLEECTLEIDLSRDVHTPLRTDSSQLVHLAHLRSFTVEFHRTHYAGTNLTLPEAFFAHLVCPTLSSLVANWPSRQTFEGGMFARDPDTCPFLTFLRQSDCASTLEVFESDLPDGGASLENIALALPFLVEFRVKDAGTFNESLEMKVKEGRVLRKLKVLVTSTLDLSRFLDMLEGRWAVQAAKEGTGADGEDVISGLEYVMVEHYDAISQENACRVDALREKGVGIQTAKTEPQYQLYD